MRYAASVSVVFAAFTSSATLMVAYTLLDAGSDWRDALRAVRRTLLFAAAVYVNVMTILWAAGDFR